MIRTKKKNKGRTLFLRHFSDSWHKLTRFITFGRVYLSVVSPRSLFRSGPVPARGGPTFCGSAGRSTAAKRASPRAITAVKVFNPRATLLSGPSKSGLLHCPPMRTTCENGNISRFTRCHNSIRRTWSVTLALHNVRPEKNITNFPCTNPLH